jgi:hypothetical protein
VRLIAKPILIPAAILLLAVSGATLALNLYLQSEGARKLLNEELSKLTGTPVSIRSTFALPVLGIRLTGVTAGTDPSHPLLSAESITLRPDYLDLLHGRLAIDGISLNRPVLHLTIGTPHEGKSADWIHESNSFDLSSDFRQSTAQQDHPLVTNSSPPPSSVVTEVNHPSFISASRGELLHRVTIRNGEMILLNENGTPAIAFTGIHLDATSHRGVPWHGNIEITQAVLADHLIIHQISSSLLLSQAALQVECEKVHATLGGGSLEGKGTFSLDPHQPAYSVSLKLDQSSLPQLLTDATFGASSAKGNISGELSLSGIAGQGATMQGQGSLLCSDAVIQPVDFLKQIGQLLSIEELQLLRLAEGKCIFSIEGGHVIIDDLFLRSENLILAARGPLHPSGELDLDSRLLFNAKLTGRLRGLLGSQLTPAPEAGYSQISFHVSGSPLSPKTDLLQRLTGLRIGGDLGGLLQGLFGRPANH